MSEVKNLAASIVSFLVTIRALITFLVPPLQACAEGGRFHAIWNPGGPWI